MHSLIKGIFFQNRKLRLGKIILSIAQFLAHEPIPYYCIYKNRILKSASFDVCSSLHSKLSPLLNATLGLISLMMNSFTYENRNNSTNFTGIL